MTALVIAAVSGAAFAMLALLVALEWGPLVAFDRQAVVQLNHLDARSSAFLSVMRAISAVASTTGWVVLLGALELLLLGQRRWRPAVFVAVTGIGSPILNAVLKDLFQRPRPVLAHPVQVASGWSFPSGHAQAATVGCAVLLVVFLPSLGRLGARWTVMASVVVVIAVAGSRMSLGVHYLSDVLGSILVGSAWTSFLVWAFGLSRRANQ